MFFPRSESQFPRDEVALPLPLMRVTPLSLKGLLLIEPKIHTDARGAFWESYRKDLFIRQGIAEEFVQDNQSQSVRGALRGLHWQVAPMAQAKLIQVVRGQVYDVVVDVRPDSSTFGQWVAERLSAEEHQMLYVPVGFAHGFLSLEDATEVLYKVTQVYSPAHERGLRWDDPDLSIRWPDLGKPYLISDRDRTHPPFRSLARR